MASTASRVRGQNAGLDLPPRTAGSLTPSPLPLSPATAGARDGDLPRTRGKEPLAPRSGERVASAASRVRGQDGGLDLAPRTSGESHPLTPAPLPRSRGGEGANAEMYRPASRVRGPAGQQPGTARDNRAYLRWDGRDVPAHLDGRWPRATQCQWTWPVRVRPSYIVRGQ